MFTSKEPFQIVSGTLSYAIGSGCIVVSMPIPDAIKSLKEEVGYLFDFANSTQ
ncbi:MAG: hypothetical protein H7296_02935 [Bacteroidia bacterium]|nr:hypothetical protein [Bacteroidia bacterium]